MLFIGGSHDGERRKVEDNRPYYKLIKRSLMPRTIALDITTPAEETVEIELYLAQRLRGKEIEFTVMCHEKLTPDEMMERLITHYTPERIELIRRKDQ